MGEKGPESRPSSGLALGRSSPCKRLISLMMTAFSSLNCSSSAQKQATVSSLVSALRCQIHAQQVFNAVICSHQGEGVFADERYANLWIFFFPFSGAHATYAHLQAQAHPCRCGSRPGT